MPLSENEKSEARAAIALALELNEPESLIEDLRRLCQRKAIDALMSDNERQRWRNAHKALDSVSSELERANAPQPRQDGATTPQGDSPTDC
jgi:hypothetical protein